MEDSSSDFAADFLKLHNQYRAIHKSPPLEIDDELSDYAQEWADNLAKRGVLEHRPETEYGENVFVSFWRDVPPDIKPKDPLEHWYREGRYFKYGDADVENLEDVRHFTQMLWNESKSIGVGLATGSDGKIYLVCNYDPPGNTDGEFAENVLPILEEEDDSQEKKDSQEGEAEILTVKARMNVVDSMERLYAVPSEKLRVWSVWLSKVGEFSDEWQRWLRSYIDLTMRLSDFLREAEESIKKSKEPQRIRRCTVRQRSPIFLPMEESKSKLQDEEEDETKTVDAFVDTTEDQETSDDQAEAEDEPEDPDEETRSESEAKPTPEAEDEPEDPDEKTRSESEAKPTPEAEDEPEDPDEKTRSESEAKPTPEMEEMLWPIGRPWEETGLVDTIEEDEFEKLPLPRDEEEMRELAQKFMQEATIFRSYYKHWSGTADQAINEIGGRLVLATYVTRGRGKRPRKRSLRRSTQEEQPLERSRSSKYYSAESMMSQPGPETKSQTSAVQSESDAQLAEATENNDDDDDGDDDIPMAPSSERPTVIENVPRAASSRLSKKSSKADPSKESLDTVSDLVKDCARAAEPIPYFFYLNAEPDIDIAIEHDDEEVIPADPNRENVLGNYRRLFFNLHDKPCKGGKPWL